MMAGLADLPEHKKRVKALLESLKHTQDADGYIGIYSNASRYQHGESENGELWGQSRAMLALLAQYELTGDQTCLQAVQAAMSWRRRPRRRSRRCPPRLWLLRSPLVRSPPLRLSSRNRPGIGHYRRLRRRGRSPVRGEMTRSGTSARMAEPSPTGAHRWRSGYPMMSSPPQKAPSFEHFSLLRVAWREAAELTLYLAQPVEDGNSADRVTNHVALLGYESAGGRRPGLPE